MGCEGVVGDAVNFGAGVPIIGRDVLKRVDGRYFGCHAG